MPVDMVAEEVTFAMQTCRERLTANPEGRFAFEDVTTTLMRGATLYARAYTGTFEFMVDMRRHALRGSLSQAQAKGVLNCMLAEVRRQARAEAPAETVDMSALMTLFQRAGTHLRNPRITLTGVTLKLMTRGLHPGTINLVSGRWPDQTWYGRIGVDGSLVRGRAMTEPVMELIRELAADPVAAAQRYAGLTGNCCFCNLRLTDERSTSAGYGPICAQHYGLPWGDGGRYEAGTPEQIAADEEGTVISVHTPEGFTYTPREARRETPTERIRRRLGGVSAMPPSHQMAIEEFGLGITDTTVLCQECGRVVPVSQSNWSEVPSHPERDGNVCNACSGM